MQSNWRVAKMKLISIGFLLLTIAINANGAILRDKNRGSSIFGDLAKGAATVAAVSLLPPQMNPMMMQQQQMQMQQQQAQQAQALNLPAPPAVDIEKSEALNTRQQLLSKELATRMEEANSLKAKLEEIKKFGGLEKPHGITAFQGTKGGAAALASLAAEGATAPIGEALDSSEAPIIFLQPPPIKPKDQISIEEQVECILQRIGDVNSPAMKEYNKLMMHKLGSISAHSLDETQSEIKATESEIEKRQNEREEILKKLKKQGRELAKHGSNKLRAEVAFTNQDLESKDKEISVLIEKLSVLKKKEAALIKQGPGKEAEKEEESEEENEKEITEE